ncbi:F-actin-capping protein subunit alpha-2-like [Sceloporus undulatus]|uniref:F-actin-capping protein subunit alpha-2-like n=1 Tax=Sceloporus undulatus TaxID=8520 RepID=UPI001C4C3E4B|nr:F-actin-capping protein subunit alpha-2-like [Sceloporus undulatus]
MAAALFLSILQPQFNRATEAGRRDSRRVSQSCCEVADARELHGPDLAFVSQANMSQEQMSRDNPLAKLEKAQVVSRLLKQAPPGEFNEVFSDLRMLVGDDAMMSEEAENLCAVHNKDHFTPVKTEKCEVLLTRHNELEENRFLDPQSQVSFKYDHLKRIPSDFQTHHEETTGEVWRRALYDALKAYVCNHYPEGLCSVFIKDTAVRKIFVACIESHRHKSSAFWNGLWKSEWTFALIPASTSTEVTGNILVQAHYFEDGNMHLTVTKNVEETLLVTDKTQTAEEFVKLVKKVENEVQHGLMEEYRHMNGTYLKSFRRQLPITHTSLDWEKVVMVRIVEARAIQ